MDLTIRCAHTDVLPIAELKKKFHPKNPNQHTDEQIDRIAKILKAQGARKAAVISRRSDLITAGHGRILGAERAGFTHYPVDYQDYDSEELEYADLTADNAVAAWSELDLSAINQHVIDLGPDFDIDLLGIEGFVLEPAEKLEPGCDEDEVPSVRTETISKPGDVWQLGRHRLMCGDSVNTQHVDALLNGEKPDMVYTDPPYGMSVVKKKGMVHGVGIKGACESGVYSPVIGDDSTETAIDAVKLCLALGVPILVFWGANFYASALPDNSGWICWDKDNGEDFFADGELAWTNTDRQLRIFKHQWKGMIKASERGEKRVHPTQKPIALAEWTFEKYGKDADSVLDLFGGSGSTLIACEKTNRRCFMMELDPKYCDVIVARFEKYTGQKAERLNGETQEAG